MITYGIEHLFAFGSEQYSLLTQFNLTKFDFRPALSRIGANDNNDITSYVPEL